MARGVRAVALTTDDPIAVVDTNVLLDLYSWHDSLNHYEPPAPAPTPGLNEPASVWRRARAREALLLAIYLHKTNAVTFSLSEAVAKMNEVVNPKDRGDPKTQFTTVFLSS